EQGGIVVNPSCAEATMPPPFRGCSMLHFRVFRVLAFAAALACWLAAAMPAFAQADFYRGKTIELIVSTGVGGGLDANAGLVARHLASHIGGNPSIVAKNMPGAGHIRAANYVFSQAPRDGTT